MLYPHSPMLSLSRGNHSDDLLLTELLRFVQLDYLLDRWVRSDLHRFLMASI
jgi:hypothetical protein